MIAQKPMNIFALIDEESSLNYTTDETMLTKLKSIHGNNDLFEVTRQGTEVFFVKHFAGDVCYTVDGMLEKNRDTFHTDSLNVIGGSTNKFLVYLFNKEIKEWLYNFDYRNLLSREKYMHANVWRDHPIIFIETFLKFTIFERSSKRWRVLSWLF